MDVILHCGAHRAATTSFQSYMRQHAETLLTQGIGFWGPWRTRKGLFHDLTDPPVTRARWDRAVGRVRMNVDLSAQRGATQLVVSDENMIGTTRQSLRARALYPDIGERMARIHAGFGTVSRVVLQIRSPETWWSSAMAMLVARGIDLPSVEVRDAISETNRSWRDVISDLSCACPDSEIIVTLFEDRCDRPSDLLAAMTGLATPPQTLPREFWVNRSPKLPALRRILAGRDADTRSLPEGEGRWHPFSAAQGARLRELYADDLYWLRAGADGLARFNPLSEPKRPGITPAPASQERGHSRYDRSARRLA